jgi:hypothetical protein
MDKWLTKKPTMRQNAGTAVKTGKTAAEETIKEKQQESTKKRLQQRVPSNRYEEKC